MLYTYLVKSCLTEKCVKFSCTEALSLSEFLLVDLLFESCFALALSMTVPSAFAVVAGEWDDGSFDTGISCLKSTDGDFDRNFNDTLFDDLQRQKR